MLLTRQSARAKIVGHLRAEHGRVEPHARREVELADEALQLAAVLALGCAQRRPVHLEARVEPASSREPDGAHDRRRAPSPASSGRARRRGSRSPAAPPARQGNSSRSMPCPIATTFRESIGNERRSTLITAVARLLGRLERPRALPVREPEEDRHAAAAARAARRARRRSGTCARRPRSAAACARAPSSARPGSARRARPSSARRSSALRQFGGSAPGSTRSASTTTSSTRSASARIFGIVAASAGCAGSTCWVMKTSRRIRRSPCRRG